MRASLLPLALVALALPVPAFAYPNSYRLNNFQPNNFQQNNYQPNSYQRYTYETYGPPQRVYAPRARYRPLPVSRYGGYPTANYPGGNGYPTAQRSCSLATPLVGAALGGTLGAALANGSRNRRWALPMGAAFGGILGGVVSGC